MLVHPECTAEVVKKADFAGSTSEIIHFACQSEKKGISHWHRGRGHVGAKAEMPGKGFLSVKSEQCCRGDENGYPGKSKRRTERRKISGSPG